MNKITQLAIKTVKDISVDDLANEAINLVGVEKNDYLQKILADSINDIDHKTTVDLFKNGKLAEIQDTIVKSLNDIKPIALNDLTDKEMNRQKNITSWIVNLILNEKIKDRLALVNANYWKYINGGLTIVIPIITNILQYVISNYALPDVACGSVDNTNSTLF